MFNFNILQKRPVSQQVKEDLAGAQGLLRQRSYVSGFRKYSGSFLFTTENQSGINEIIGYKGKNVFTVASSGDQYLGAVYYDALDVDLFDINRMTYYITCLKIAAIVVLDYQEFIDFFVPLDEMGALKKSFWDLRVLKRLLKVLPNDVAYVWDKIMYTARKRGFTYLICPDHHSNVLSNVTSGMPFYQNEEEYYKLQEKLRKRSYPHFLESDVLLLKDKLTSSYDIIYLSNMVEGIICDEIDHTIHPREQVTLLEKQIFTDILRGVLPALNDGGVILLSYRPNRDLQLCPEWSFNNNYFECDLIPCKYPPDIFDCYASKNTDVVLTYRPKKTGNIFDRGF